MEILDDVLPHDVLFCARIREIWEFFEEIIVLYQSNYLDEDVSHIFSALSEVGGEVVSLKGIR